MPEPDPCVLSVLETRGFGMLQSIIAILAGLVVGLAATAMGVAGSVSAGVACWIGGGAVGAFIASFLAPKLAARSWWRRRFPGWCVASVIAALGGIRLVLSGQPAWFAATGVFAIFLLAALAQRLAVRFSRRGRPAGAGDGGAT